MANIHRVYVCTKWVSDEDGNRPDFGDFITLAQGESWQDATGQPAANLPITPNLYIVEAWLQDANWNKVKGSNRFFVLARQTYDDKDPETFTFNDFDEQPTAQQLTAFGQAILTKFPDVDVSDLKDGGKDILKAGLNRAQITTKLTARWRKFLKVLA